jgi:hypothetical protein
VVTAVRNQSAALAVKQFGQVTRDLEDSPITEPANMRPQMERLKEYLDSYYAQELAAKKINLRPLLPLQRSAVWLQATYLALNAKPVAKKWLSDNSKDEAPYSAYHDVWHPIFRETVERFGLQDLYLIDVNTGRVLYSVGKGPDFQTGLLDGPYADSTLGVLFRRLRVESCEGDYLLLDFAPYMPAHGRPVLFAGSPVFENGQKTGVLIVQVSITGIQTETNDSVSGMEHHAEQVEEQTTLVSEAGTTLERIERASMQSAELIAGIPLAASQQARSTFRLSESMLGISEAARQAPVASEHIQRNAGALLQVASDLDTRVKLFCVSENGNGRAAPPAHVVQLQKHPPHGQRTARTVQPRAERHSVMSPSLKRYAPLRAAVQMLADALRAELSYLFAALRSFVAVEALSRGADRVFAAIAREQSYVLGEAIDHLDRFRARSRRAETSAELLVALCRALERPNAPGDGALLCEYIIDSGQRMPAGPLTLAPLLGTFLRAHLRRRADAPGITIRITAEGALLRYRPRPPVQPTSDSWPLLLAALAVAPWGWQLLRRAGSAEEAIVLRPA